MNFVNIVTSWLFYDLLVLIVISYGVNVVKPYFPQWWEKHIVRDEPANFREYPENNHTKGLP
jgi:hypothetical protein